MKICAKCRAEKTLDCFTKDKNQKDGLMRWCRPCRAEYKKASYERHREKNLLKQKKYREENREKVSGGKKLSRLKKLDEYKAAAKARYFANREEILAKEKTKRLENYEEALAKEAEVRARHAEKRSAYQRDYYRRNKASVLAYSAKYQRERCKADPIYALGKLVRRRIAFALQKSGYQKESPTHEMLGCTFEYLKAHLERQFLKGMSWENRGPDGWHIDHIVPLSSAKTKDDMLALCHFTNLRPLWAEDNLSKGDKIEHLI